MALFCEFCLGNQAQSHDFDCPRSEHHHTFGDWKEGFERGYQGFDNDRRWNFVFSLGHRVGVARAQQEGSAPPELSAFRELTYTEMFEE